MKKIEEFYVITIGYKFLAFDNYSGGYPYLSDYFNQAKIYNDKSFAEKDIKKLNKYFINLDTEKAKIQKIEIIMEDQR